MIDYRVLSTPAEMEAIVDLEILVWGMNARDAVPGALLTAFAHHGGHVLGAYDGQRLIGFSAAFVARDGDMVTLWSHMAAVHPDYQSQGVGFQIKQEQRTWALAHGYTRMGWTFDPMQPRNAKFNLRQLGVTCWRYHPNFYGTMQDSLNAGAVPLPSDRLEATWDLNSPMAQALARGEALSTREVPGPFLIERDDSNSPQVRAVDWSRPFYCVELPLESSIMRKNEPLILLEWQTQIREVLRDAFLHGYRAVDFVIQNGRGWYMIDKFPQA